MKHIIIYILIAIALVGAVLSYNKPQSKKAYYYNAYAPGYDEYFIVKSHTLLPFDTIVHFDDHAVVTHEKTGYTAKILSPYTDTIK